MKMDQIREYYHKRTSILRSLQDDECMTFSSPCIFSWTQSSERVGKQSPSDYFFFDFEAARLAGELGSGAFRRMLLVPSADAFR